MKKIVPMNNYCKTLHNMGVEASKSLIDQYDYDKFNALEHKRTGDYKEY